MGELDDKVAIVTGAASGIGLGIAERFLAEGARVVLADVDADHGAEAVRDLGADAAFKHTDVARPEQVVDLVAFAIETFGGLQVMVNNAGISGVRNRSLLDDDFADFHQVMGVNLLGVMVGTREAARHMADSGGGSIINVSSVGGIQPGPSLAAYHASKASILVFSRAAAVDVGQYGIRVNCIAPGNIETPILEQTMAAHLPEEERAEAMTRIRAFIIGRQPIPRQGTTTDLAEAALWLAGDRSSFVTGTVLPVDGGLLAGTPMRGQGVDAARDIRPSPTGNE